MLLPWRSECGLFSLREMPVVRLVSFEHSGFLEQAAVMLVGPEKGRKTVFHRLLKLGVSSSS